MMRGWKLFDHILVCVAIALVVIFVFVWTVYLLAGIPAPWWYVGIPA